MRINSRLGTELNVAGPAGNGSSGMGHGEGTRPWMMTSAAIEALPADVRATVAEHELDLNVQPLTVVLDTLHAKSVAQRMNAQIATMPAFKADQ